MNFSKIITLPKNALEMCGCNLDDRDIRVNISLVEDNDEKFIKVIPVCKVKTEEE